MFKTIIENTAIINLLSNIGAFISAIIAIYTLREVKKQRLSTYKPELLLKSFLVYIHKSPLCLDEEELLLFKSENFNEYKDEKTQKKEYQIFPLYKIENLGFGLAKNITVTWSFDMKKALEILEREFNEDFYFSQFKPLNYFFLNKKSNEGFHMSFTNENKTLQTTDYIAPINVKEHTHYHAIPKDIVVMHFMYFIFRNKLLDKININKNYSKFENFPKVKMTVKYSDLNNKKYTNKYYFKTSIVVTQIDEKIDLGKEFGYLLFEIQ